MLNLCRRIGMPEEVTREVLRWHLDPDFHPNLTKLTREGRPVISLHIPTDARLETALLR